MVRNILLLASGTALSQAIILMAIPVLSRLYAPSDFGSFAIVMAALAVLSPFSTLRYETAILIKEKKHPPSSLLLLSIAIASFSSLIFLAFGANITNLLGMDLPERQLHILVFMFFLAGANEILGAWHTRNERFGIIACGKLIQAVSTVAFQITLSNEHGAYGLLYGYAIGSLLSFIYYSWQLIWKDSKSIDYSTSIKHIRTAAITHKNFPLFSVWATLLNSVANQLPIILFSNYFSASVTGSYEMSRKVTRAPLSLVGQSIFRVASQRVGSLAEDKAKSARVLELLFIRMANYTVVPFVLVVFHLDDIFELVLGPQWIEAGQYAQTISPWLFTVFLSWPLTSAYNTFGYQAGLVIFNMVFIVCISVGFVAHALLGIGVIGVLMIISLLSSIARLGYCYWVLNKCGADNLKSNFLLVILYVIAIGIAAHAGA